MSLQETSSPLSPRDSEGVSLAAAGSPLDVAFSEDEGPPPVAAGLREVVPAPEPVAFEKLEEEVDRHRLLVWRGGAVIAVTTLVSVGGALLLHSLFAGIFVAGLLWGHGTPRPGDGDGGEAAAEGGSGYMVLNDDSLEAPSKPPPKLGVPEGTVASLEPPAPPALPPALPEAAVPDSPTPPAIVPPALVSVAPADLGTVKVLPPPPTAQVPPAEQTLSIAPPAPPAAAAPSPAAAPSTPAAVANARGGSRVKGRGSPEGDLFGEDDNEPMFSVVKGDGGGEGSGHGNGIDRGLSAANAQPQLLAAPAFPLPLQYALKPPQRALKLEITIKADGSIGSIATAQSCGISDLDDQIREHILSNFHFRPAFSRGKPVESVFTFVQSFRDGD